MQHKFVKHGCKLEVCLKCAKTVCLGREHRQNKGGPPKSPTPTEVRLLRAEPAAKLAIEG